MLKKSTVEMKKKAFYLLCGFFVLFIVLIGQLTYTVLVEGKYYNLAVLQNAAKREQSITLNDKRGLIYDRNGILLADSVPTFDLIFDAKLLTTLSEEAQEKTINFLKSSLNFDVASTRTLLEEQKDNNYIILGKNYSYTEFKTVKEAIDKVEVKGLFYREGYTRDYPYPTLAADIIGFVDADLNGRIGIESIYNEELKGTSGRVFGAVDTDKKLDVKEIGAVDGANLMLTLDFTVQKHINESIKKYLETDQATRIHVIVMNPKNGEILGMANYPDFSLEKPYEVEAFKNLKQFEGKSDSDILNILWGNENVNGTYEPGSTFKPFVVAAALEENAVSHDDRFMCTGSKKVGNFNISCWEERGHGEQTIEEAIANSCNVALMEIGEKLGRDLFYKYQRSFGFASLTGIDLTGETSARVNVYELDELNPVELATSSFGQGFNLTPIQLITGFSALINGGYLYEPHLMKKIYTDEKIVATHENVLYRQVISEDVSHLSRQILGDVVNEGTGKKASIAGYQIGGKTGTAEKNARDDQSYIVSFIGFAPVDDPQVITLVVVDEPVGIKVNSRYAAKIFVDIMEDVMPYLNIFKEEPKNEETPSTEAPTTEVPSAEVPTTEAPSAEVPTTEAPSTETPTDESNDD